MIVSASIWVLTDSQINIDFSLLKKFDQSVITETVADIGFSKEKFLVASETTRIGFCVNKFIRILAHEVITKLVYKPISIFVTIF